MSPCIERPAPRAALPFRRRSFGCGWLGCLLWVAGCSSTPTARPVAGSGAPTAAPDATTQQAEAPKPAADGPADDDGPPRPGAAPDGASSSNGASASAGPPAAGQGPEKTACTDSPGLEEPIHERTMGEGDRLIRVRNLTGVPVRLRLLGAHEQPALAGTLHLEAGGQGEIHVPGGDYQIRYRLEPSCEVLRGSRIPLTGNRAGVEISLRAGRGAASRGSVQHVREEL